MLVPKAWLDEAVLFACFAYFPGTVTRNLSNFCGHIEVTNEKNGPRFNESHPFHPSIAARFCDFYHAIIVEVFCVYKMFDSHFFYILNPPNRKMPTGFSIVFEKRCFFSGDGLHAFATLCLPPGPQCYHLFGRSAARCLQTGLLLSTFSRFMSSLLARSPYNLRLPCCQTGLRLEGVKSDALFWFKTSTVQNWFLVSARKPPPPLLEGRPLVGGWVGG